MSGPDPRGAMVRQLLDAYVAEDEREVRHAARMRELLETTPAPFSRDQFEPGHFTASAFVVSPSAASTLLIAHPTLGLWLQPGGHIEPADASPLEAARREMLEETGLADVRMDEAPFDVDVHEIPARATAPAHFHFDLRFFAVVGGLPEPSSLEGVSARWVLLKDLSALTTDQSVRRMARKAEGERDRGTEGRRD